MQKESSQAEKLRPSPPLLPASGFPRFFVLCGTNRHLSVFSPSFHAFSLVPSGRGKGACYGGVAPLRGPFPNPRIPPPCLALSLFVRCPPVPTKASLSEHSDLPTRDRMEGHAQAPRHADTLPAVRPGRGLGGSQVVPAPLTVSTAAGRGTHKRQHPCPDFMPPRIRGWMYAPACSESEAFVGTGGQ